MKEQYIQAQIAEIKEKIKNNNSKKDIVSMISILGMCLFGTMAFVSMFSYPAILVSMLSMLGVTGIKKYKSDKLSAEEIKKLNQELEHLENINQETPESNKVLDTKRKAKIKKLEKEYNEENDTYKLAKVVSKAGGIVTLGYAVVSMLAPMIAPVFGSIIPLVGYGIVGKLMLKQKPKLENLDNRITNLKNDLKVIEYDNSSNQANTNTNQNRLPRRSNRASQNQNVRPLPQQNNSNVQQPRPLPHQPRRSVSNEQAVNRYVNNMASAQTKEMPQQKVKS